MENVKLENVKFKSISLAAELKNYKGKTVEIMGYYVTSKHTQTKHKEHMMFGTFLDRDGYFFDTTHFPKIAAQFPFTGRGCYCIKGKVAEEFGFYSLDVMEMRRVDWPHPGPPQAGGRGPIPNPSPKGKGEEASADDKKTG